MERSKINKTEVGFSYPRMVLYGIATELILVALQFVYIRIYTGESKFVFDDNYMRYGGFYIFQLIGFFLYVMIVYFLCRRLETDLIRKIAAFVVAGCLTELAFYFTIQADWQGVFSYSVLTKLIAATFGIVISLYSSKKLDRKIPK